MGRSVSYPSKCEEVCFRDISYMGYTDIDEDGNEITLDTYDESLGQIEWEIFVEDIQHRAKEQWRSLQESEKWIGREDKAILENRFCYIGVSEYCGMAAVWLVPKQDFGCYDTYEGNFAGAWCGQISKKFRTMFNEYVKVGSFSNGEGIYQKVA